MATIELPAWARVSARRREHIGRVVALLDDWAAEMRLPPDEARAWHDAGCWHDALRDAPPDELAAILGGGALPPAFRHGPAAAAMLARDGERRGALLDAIRWHTVGSDAWAPVGRALYMADYLEPGREFAREARAALAARVPHAFDAVFREVVRERLVNAVRKDHPLRPESVAMWNAVA